LRVVDLCNYIINGASPSVDPAVARVGDSRPWRPFIPESYGAQGHWVLNARSARESGRTCERIGRQDPARSRHTIGRFNSLISGRSMMNVG